MHLTGNRVADVETHLGNEISSVSRTSTAANAKKIASDNIVMPKVKNVAATLKYWHKVDPTMGLKRPISVLSSVEKNTIEGMNQRCSQH